MIFGNKTDGDENGGGGGVGIWSPDWNVSYRKCYCWKWQTDADRSGT